MANVPSDANKKPTPEAGAAQKPEGSDAAQGIGEPQGVPAAHVPDKGAAPVQAAGDILKERRVLHGLDIETVSNDLKIRSAYLDAIENKRYSLLPGDTYSIGFVRSYASYLGLPAEEVVQAFRSERTGKQKFNAVDFPSPVSDGGAPGKKLLLLGVGVVVASALGWLAYSQSDKGLMETISSIPAEIQAQVDKFKSTPEGDAVRAELTTEGADQDNNAGEAPPVQPEAQTSTPELDANDANRESDAEAGAATAPAEVTENAQSAINAPDEAEAPADPPAADPSAADPAPAAEEQPAESADTAESTQEQAPIIAGKTYGAQSGPVDVVVVAEVASWVQFSQQGGRTIFTRVLKKGDAYRVPQNSDLKFKTGNAGGVRIYIKGTKMPLLGPIGTVRSGVPMNTDDLQKWIEDRQR
jgi:cytoskeleton protein RodZ